MFLQEEIHDVNQNGNGSGERNLELRGSLNPAASLNLLNDSTSSAQQQLLEIVLQLQEQLSQLLQEKSELRQQLHQSKLLCAELNAQLLQMQHWHQPGIIAGEQIGQ
ncbi:uncharacterized protein LOC125177925 [Hyalella azteca]|uniref:Uncharacterized protein LOC125177925 n=1 Tax=Hyalella azteca TaxID=294128 RepID=A0A979FIN7_HYAAZ|nr:uncharacterized protein LOC125177925 [Hyalella azteca]